MSFGPISLKRGSNTQTFLNLLSQKCVKTDDLWLLRNFADSERREEAAENEKWPARRTFALIERASGTNISEAAGEGQDRYKSRSSPHTQLPNSSRGQGSSGPQAAREKSHHAGSFQQEWLGLWWEFTWPSPADQRRSSLPPRASEDHTAAKRPQWRQRTPRV